MLIIGAKGFAKEILEICHQNKELDELAFYDDLNTDIGDKLFSIFPILKTEEEVKKYFKKVDEKFTIGLGNPKLRIKMYNKFSSLGGVFTTTISKYSIIGNYSVVIGEGCNIMSGVVITNDIKIGNGVIINQLASIGHDVEIGDFVEICPNVSVSGKCKIGDNVFIGTGATILPGISIGNNVVVGAGAVVSKNLPNDCVAVGIPAKIIKQN